MAFTGPQVKIPGALAAGDLSSDQFKFMVKNTTDKQYALATAVGEPVHGVLQDKPSAANKAAEICADGITKMQAGGTLTAGDPIITDAAGKAIAATITGGGENIVGHVIVGCASGEVATVWFKG